MKIGFFAGIFLLLMSVSSCFSVKPTTQNAGTKQLETFYTGDDETLYFVKPLAFETSSGQKLWIDLTFRQGVKFVENAITTLNVSLLTKEAKREVKALEIRNTDYKATPTIKEILFIQREGNDFKLRFSTELTALEVSELFKNEKWEVYVDENPEAFIATKKTQKNIAKIDNSVFALFR